MTDTFCASCKRKLTNFQGSTEFKCPGCEKHTIARCLNCRKISARYNCPECSFNGPN